MPSTIVFMIGAYAITSGMIAAVVAIAIVASVVMNKAFAVDVNYGDPSGQSPNLGNRQQLPPATDNKLPVVYGSAYVGGIITDLSITSNNKVLYYVISLCEVTNNGADQITFGNVYFGGKKVIFKTAPDALVAIGTTLSVSGSTIIYTSLNQSLAIGTTLKFTGSNTVYTVTNYNYDINTFVVSPATSGVGSGATIYLYENQANYATRITGLLDESTGIVDTKVAPYLKFYFYSDGSYAPTNSDVSAVALMQSEGLIYQWNSTKIMSNCAFMILVMEYNSSAGITGMQATKFQVTNSRSSAGDCFYDYLTNTVYGAALPTAQIDTTSLNALNAYSNQSFTYTSYEGATTTQPRFKFNGVIDVSRTIMANLQDMSSCCDCLIKYNEITAKWGVIVQSPTYTIAMNLNDSNMVSAISISPIDLAGSYNVAEVKYPDNSSQDSFNSVTYDLAKIDPALLFPNEPVNKQSLNLPLCNNDVQAQYLANRFLKSAREDLLVQVSINYSGIQLEAGDIVTITNSNYGWVAKEFRINKVTEEFADDGAVLAKLMLNEFNPAIYNDVSITQFDPAPNTGIGDPTFFGTVPIPTASAGGAFAAEPNILINVTTSSSGITQYAEVWYSAFSNPTTSQIMFAGTTAVQPSGNPYGVNVLMPVVSLTGIAAGSWYFFSRMVNSLGSSIFSQASSVVNWKPMTFQYVNRYINVMYADNASGGGFSSNPRYKTYFGLFNNTSTTPSINPADYAWYEATPEPFGDSNYVLYATRGNRRCSFAVDNAAYLGIGGSFVPTETSVYDPTTWNGVIDGTNSIDLDMRSGQLTKVGTSSVSTADGLLSVTNNTQGTMIVSLQKFLNFGNGVYSKNFNPASLTIDIYGRVVGFSEEDAFYFSEIVFIATSGQTAFPVTHIVGQALIFLDGILMDETEYTETSTSINLVAGCQAGETVVVLNMRAVSTSEFNQPLALTIASSTTNSVTYSGLPYQKILAGDLITFIDTLYPTTFTVSSINYATKVITFTGTISGATAGLPIYRHRPAGSSYAPFSRWTETFVSVGSFSPTQYALNNGFEQIYVNGAQFNEVDYNLADNVLNGFPANVTGNVDIIQFSSNNLGVPCSNITNNVAYSANGQVTYPFNSNPLAMEVYANGVLLVKGVGLDYTATSTNYNLVTPFPNNFTLLNQQTFARLGAA